MAKSIKKQRHYDHFFTTAGDKNARILMDQYVIGVLEYDGKN